MTLTPPKPRVSSATVRPRPYYPLMNAKVFTHKQDPAKHHCIKHVSKSTAEKWVLVGTHYWFDLKRRMLQEISPKLRIVRCSVGYIPEKLPPMEIPGVIFRGPAKFVQLPSEVGQ